MKRIFFFLILLSPYFCYSQVWKSFGVDSLYIPGNPESFVSTFKVINNNLFVSGRFGKSSTQDIKCIAIWDSINWHPLAEGLQGWGISIQLFQNKIYTGGNFIYAGNNVNNTTYLACWNDTVWQPVGSIGSPNSWVEAISFKNMLYIGGGFGGFGYTGPNATSFNCIAAWDGAQWHHVNNFDNGISAFTIYNNELYAGGYFSVISGAPNYCVGIARDDGAQWHDVGGGLGGYVKTLLADTINNVLYAGGVFSVAGYLSGDSLSPNPVPVRNIAKWDGAQWSDVGGGFNYDVYTLCLYRGELYAGGWFDTAGTQRIPHLAKYNGSNWESVGSGVDGIVQSLIVYKDELYVGGGFKHAGGLASSCIAKWYIHPDSVFIGNGELKMENVPELKVYPNPTNGNITVEFILPQPEKAVLKIYNSKGELFRKFIILDRESKKDIDTSKWAKGVYYCVLEQRNKRLLQVKFIVE
ncbi:MAG: T9SS type A sorting domain-containing protein [Bacteroidia bacterium]|nr:T9SS type A sorting domain-containing protein [Bacteroidia bacterium]